MPAPITVPGLNSGSTHSINSFDHLKRVLMGVMLEPRSNSKRPLFGKIFQPPIDALRDTDINTTRLDYLQIDYIVRKCNNMIMEWSKLYSNKNNEHLPYKEFLALIETTLTIPNSFYSKTLMR